MDSSTVMTPSLPTFSIASAMVSPMASSWAERLATWLMRSRVSTVWDIPRSSSTTAETACSMPRLMAIGLLPAVTFLKPSLMRLWARTMEVVVPSPAASLVLVAASLRS